MPQKHILRACVSTKEGKAQELIHNVLGYQGSGKNSKKNLVLGREKTCTVRREEEKQTRAWKHHQRGGGKGEASTEGKDPTVEDSTKHRRQGQLESNPSRGENQSFFDL